MRFKLDENFGTRAQDIFRKAALEVYTVRDQKLQGCSDQKIFAVCTSEKTCLVTLDKDFSDVTRFPPKDTGGIVVIRLPRNSNFTLIKQLILQFIHSLEKIKLENNLWIIEPGRIRIHQAKEEEER